MEVRYRLCAESSSRSRHRTCIHRCWTRSCRSLAAAGRGLGRRLPPQTGNRREGQLETERERGNGKYESRQLALRARCPHTPLKQTHQQESGGAVEALQLSVGSNSTLGGNQKKQKKVVHPKFEKQQEVAGKKSFVLKFPLRCVGVLPECLCSSHTGSTLHAPRGKVCREEGNNRGRGRRRRRRRRRKVSDEVVGEEGVRGRRGEG